MPPAPPPASIHTLLSSLRSPIFHTAHNPTSLRTGTKYLRRRLVGPSAIAYYPRMPKLATLNKLVPWNAYGGWRGEGTPAYRAEVVERGSSGQEGRWSATPSSSSASGATESESVVKSGDEGGEIGVRWANQGIMLPQREVVEAGWVEVGRIAGAGWLDDAKERTRREEVALSKESGRGPPKKGQGKRSQMKKR